MGKLDQVSLEIGKLKGTVRGMVKSMDTHHKEAMDEFEKMDSHLQEINGNLSTHENDIKNLKDSRWNWKKASIVIGIIAVIISIVTSVIIPFSGAVESCTNREIGINEQCHFSTWVWNRTSSSYITAQIAEINITNENGVSEASALMSNNPNGLHNYTFSGSATAGYKYCVISAAISSAFIPVDCSFVVNESTQDLINSVDTLLQGVDSNITSINETLPNDIWSVATRTLTSFGSLISDTWAYSGGRNLTSFEFSVGLNSSGIDDIDLRINQSHGVGDYNGTGTTNNTAIAIAVWNNSIVTPGSREVNATNEIIASVDSTDIAIQVWNESIVAPGDREVNATGVSIGDVNVTINETAIAEAVWNYVNVFSKTMGDILEAIYEVVILS